MTNDPDDVAVADVLGRARERGFVARDDELACREIARALPASEGPALVAIARGLLGFDAAAKLVVPPREDDEPPTAPTMLVTRVTTQRISQKELARAAELRARAHDGGVVHFKGKLGDYYLLEPLGRGGMGQVVKAYHRQLDRTVAIKCIDLAAQGDAAAELLQRFEHEVRLASRLDHPNIVRIHAVSLDARCPYVVMGYVVGVPLSQLIRKRELRVRAAVRIARDLARALEHAHQRGVLHGDLKPGNVLVTPAGTPVLVDFGVAAPLVGPGRQARLSGWGTANYMSPEQIRGEPCDARSDVFSLGAVLFEMLDGKRLFDGANPEDTTRRVLAGHVPALDAEEADARLEGIVRRALAVAPGERHPDAEAVAADLEAWLAGPGTALSAVDPIRPRLRVERRRTAVLRIAISVFAVLTCAVAFRVAQAWRDEAEDVAALRSAERALAARDRSERVASARVALARGLGHWRAMETLAAAGDALGERQAWSDAEQAFDEAEPLMSAAIGAGASELAVDRARMLQRRLHRARFELDLAAVRRFSAALDVHEVPGGTDTRGTGTLEIATIPGGGRIEVLIIAERDGVFEPGDCAARGLAPLRCELRPGRYVVTAEQSGCLPSRDTVYVSWGERVRLDLALVPSERGVEGMVAIPGGRASLGAPPRRAAMGPLLVAAFETRSSEYLAYLATLPTSAEKLARAPRTDRGPLWRLDANGDVTLPADWSPERPVTAISWDDARCYAQWRARALGRRLRLPTALEWERAARGGDGRIFPWGALPGARSYGGVTAPGALSPPTAVGLVSGDTSPFGVRDLVGSVREWVADTPAESERIACGGSYLAEYGVTARLRLSMGATAIDLGFRLVCDPTE